MYGDENPYSKSAQYKSRPRDDAKAAKAAKTEVSNYDDHGNRVETFRHVTHASEKLLGEWFLGGAGGGGTYHMINLYNIVIDK